jgi:hypothetical protein
MTFLRAASNSIAFLDFLVVKTVAAAKIARHETPIIETAEAEIGYSSSLMTALTLVGSTGSKITFC